MPERTFTDVLELIAGKAEDYISQGIEMAEVRGFLEAHRETLDTLPEEGLKSLLGLAMSHVDSAGLANVVVTPQEVNAALAANAEALAALQEKQESLRRLVSDLTQLATKATMQSILALLTMAAG